MLREGYDDIGAGVEPTSGSTGIQVTPAPAETIGKPAAIAGLEPKYAAGLEQKPTSAEKNESNALGRSTAKSNWSVGKMPQKKSKLKKKLKQKILIGVVLSVLGLFTGGLGGLTLLSAGRMFILDGALFEKFNRPQEIKLARHSFRSMKPVFDEDGNFAGRTQTGRYGKALSNINKTNVMDDIKAAGWEPQYDQNNRSLLGFAKNAGEEFISVDDFSTFGRRRALGEVLRDVYPRGRLTRSTAARLVGKEFGGEARFLFVEKKLGAAEKKLSDIGSSFKEARNGLRKRIRQRIFGGDEGNIETAVASRGKTDYPVDENGNPVDAEGNKLSADDIQSIDDAARESTEELATDVNKVAADAIEHPEVRIQKFSLGSDAFKNFFKSKWQNIKNPKMTTIAQMGAVVCQFSGLARAITDQGREKTETGAKRLYHINRSASQQLFHDDKWQRNEYEREAYVEDFSNTKNPDEEIGASPGYRRILQGDDRVTSLGDQEMYSLNPQMPSPWAGIFDFLKKIPAGVCGVVTDAKFQIGVTLLEIGSMFIPGGQGSEVFKQLVKQGFVRAVKTVAVQALKGLAIGASIGAVLAVFKYFAESALAGNYGDNTASPSENTTALVGGGIAAIRADARGLGGSELSGSKAIVYQREATEDIVTEYASMPWYQRWFSPMAPRSLTAYAVLNSPSTINVVAKQATRYAFGPTLPSSFFSANGTFSKYASRIINHGNVYAESREDIIKKFYGVSLFGWTEADAQRFPNAAENAEYIESSPEITAKYEEFAKLCFESTKPSEYESDECRRDDDQAWRFRKYRYNVVGLETAAEDSNPDYLNSKLSEIGQGDSQGSSSSTGVVGLATGDTAAIVKKILDTGRVTFDNEADKQDLVTGQGTACGSPKINIHVYQLIDAILTQFPSVNIRFGAVNSGHHCNSGQHPKGEAFDVGNEEIGAEIMPWIHDNYKSLNVYEMVYNGQSQYSIDNGELSPGTTWDGHDNHIHIGVTP